MFGEGSGLLSSTVGLNDKGNPIRNSVADGGGVRIDGVVDNGDGTYKPVTAYVDANYYYQSRKSLIWEDYVYDASYLKMRELSVTYDVPTAFLQKTKHNRCCRPLDDCPDQIPCKAARYLPRKASWEKECALHGKVLLPVP